jgi:hypothetical protein
MTSCVARALRAFGVALGGGEDVTPPVAAHHDEVVAGEAVTGGVPAGIASHPLWVTLTRVP